MSFFVQKIDPSFEDVTFQQKMHGSVFEPRLEHAAMQQRSERLNCYSLSSRGWQIGYIYLGSGCIATDSACGFEADIACLLRAKGNGFERPVGRPGAARDFCKSRPISADIHSIASNGSGRIGVETRLVGQPGYAVDAPKIKCD